MKESCEEEKTGGMFLLHCCGVSTKRHLADQEWVHEGGDVTSTVAALYLAQCYLGTAPGPLLRNIR